MKGRLKQFENWPSEIPSPSSPYRGIARRMAERGVLGLLFVAAISLYLLRPAPPPSLPIEPRLELVAAGPVPQFNAAGSMIDTGYIQRVVARIIDPSGERRVLRTIDLYSSQQPLPLKTRGLVPLASLERASPIFALPPGVTSDRYQVALEAIPFASRRAPAEARWFVQRNCGQMQLRDRPWPLWVELPRHGAFLESPFDVKGQAYEDGFVQIRTKPKVVEPRYFDKGLTQVRKGKTWVARNVFEGATEGFELYVLFAKRKEHLPPDAVLEALPFATGRVDVVGPIDFILKTLRGPVRTDQELKDELKLVETIGARLTKPDQQADQRPKVTLNYECSGTVSPEAEKMNLRYVLGVRPTPGRGYVWIQSSPWKTENGRFEGKPVKFGLTEERAERFELWLIAVQPEADVELKEYQAWLASALPEGCVRAATVKVEKPGESPRERTTRPATGKTD